MRVLTLSRPVQQRAMPAIALLLLVGCQLISPYSEEAYKQATSLKVDSLKLMDLAVSPYADHAKEVEDLKTSLQKAYEYAAGQPRNELSTEQWAILIDPDRNLLGGFLKLWQEKGTLSRPFIDEAKKLVSDAFDTIIGLESGKIKPGELQK